MLANIFMGAKIMLLNDGTDYQADDKDIVAWQRTYPAIDVHQELNAMESWLDANPTRRKTSKGIKRFINSWLARAQDRGGSPQVKQKTTKSKDISIEDKLADISWIQHEGVKARAKEFYLKTKGFYFDGEKRQNG
jgi:hypothetical protein